MYITYIYIIYIYIYNIYIYIYIYNICELKLKLQGIKGLRKLVWISLGEALQFRPELIL